MESRNLLATPLSPTGALLQHPHADSTVSIGTEFPEGSFQLSQLVNGQNTTDLLQDLALLVSQRGVVFFRAQKLGITEQREIVRGLGIVSGRPGMSGLHVHPLAVESGDLGDDVSVLASQFKNKIGIGARGPFDGSQPVWDPAEKTGFATKGWHSDVSWENVPGDYAVLRIHTQPETGGDTLWASCYEIYDRLSKPFQTFLESLEAVHDASHYQSVAARNGFELKQDRGSPQNSGLDLFAVHPVIRTNPVTGWKSVFVNPMFTKRIIGLSKDESDDILDYLYRLIYNNHDLQVRKKWGRCPPGICDVAIWDNRCTVHSGTEDYHELDNGARCGERLMGCGERPYLDPFSRSRRDCLRDQNNGGHE